MIARFLDLIRAWSLDRVLARQERQRGPEAAIEGARLRIEITASRRVQGWAP